MKPGAKLPSIADRKAYYMFAGTQAKQEVGTASLDPIFHPYL